MSVTESREGDGARLFNVMDLERATGISRHSWRAMIRRGEIATVRIGRRVRVTEEVLQAFLAEHTVPAKN